MNNTVNFCFICDDGYVMPTTVAISSLRSSRKSGIEYHVYVVAADLSGDNEAVFRDLSGEGLKVEVLKCSAESLKGLHAYKKDSVCVATPAALLKFSLGEILPHLDKVIYADGDLIFKRDVSELYGIDLGDNLVAAVPDSGKMYSRRPILNAVGHYFNSGVMLLNLRKMRDGGYAQKLLDAKRSSNDASLMDQNIFNQVFDGYVMPLPIRYNCLFVNLVRAYERHSFTFRHLNSMFGTNYRDFTELVEDAAVVHFSSRDKPWKVDNVPLVELWDESYAKSPFGSRSLSRVHSEVGCDYDFRTRAVRPYGELIVSLTTFAARIDVVHYAIESILAQTMKPDRIILWLAKEEFPEGDAALPENLTRLFHDGLEVRWVDKNLRSHKKYFYALQEFPAAAVITVDDDLIYPPNLVGQLYASYERFPNCISSVRTHLITFSEDGSVNPYRLWPQVCVDYVNRPSFRLFATTGAGVLYPPGIMPEATFNDRVFMSICPNADDVWMKMMSVAAGIKVVNPSHEKCVLKQIPGSQNAALWQGNVLRNANDEQLEAVERHCRENLAGVGSVVATILSDVQKSEIQAQELPAPWVARSPVQPRVSVIVAMSNSAVTLDRCLDSIVRQTAVDIEIICVDDGSTDCPQDIMRRYYRNDGRISAYWRTKCGVAAAFRFGMSKARGEYVAFCRAEDFVGPDYVGRLFGMVGASSPDVVLCGHRIFNNVNRSVERLYAIPSGMVQAVSPFSVADLDATFYDNLDPRLGAMLVNRRLLKDCHDLFPDVWDFDLVASMTLLAKASSIVVVNESLYSCCPQLVRDRMSRVDAYPLSLRQALSAARSNLESAGVFDRVLPGYARVAMDRIVDRILGLVAPASFRAMYDDLHDGGMVAIGLDMVSPSDVGWPRYRMLRAIVDDEDPIPFVKEAMLQKQDLEHGLRVAALSADGMTKFSKSEFEKNRQLIAAKDVRIDDLELRVKKWIRELVSTKQLMRAREAENAKIRNELLAARRECSELKRSFAYVVGMFVTWPMRVVYRKFFCR